MARDFSPAIESARQRRSSRKLFFAVEIRLPQSPGDLMPPLLRVAQADLFLPSLLTYEEFAYQSFEGALGRNPDGAEQGAWVAALGAAFDFGTAEVIDQAAGLVRSLFESAEFLALDTTDAEFVTRLYSGYLGRFPEIGGKGFWLGVLASTDRDHLLDAFESSAEFARRAGEIGALVPYEPSLRDPSAVGLADGAAADNFDFALVNLDDRFSGYLGQADRVLYPAPALVLRAYPVGDGDDYEADVKLDGYATFNAVAKKAATLTVTADVNRQGVSVGDVDTQRCKLVYKGRGCDTNDPTPTCSRIWDDEANGCASKEPAPVLIGATNNQPSFGGGPDKAVEAAGGEASEGDGTPSPDPWPDPGYTDPDDPRLGRRINVPRSALDLI